MPATLSLIDAFIHRAFAGNPAAVCLLDVPRAAAWMRALSRELHQSETGFPRCHAQMLPAGPGTFNFLRRAPIRPHGAMARWASR